MALEDDPPETGDKQESLAGAIVQQDPILKKILTVHFQPHFKMMILIGAYLSSLCCLIDFAIYLESQIEVLRNYEFTMAGTAHSVSAVVIFS